MGQGKSRWGPAPEQPYSRTMEALLCPLVSLPTPRFSAIFFTSWPLSVLSQGGQLLLSR